MDSGEKIEPAKTPPATKVTLPPDQIDLTSSSDSQYFSDSDDDSDEETGGKRFRFSNGENVGSSKKKQKLELLPLGFLDPLPPDQDDVVLLPLPEPVVVRNQVGVKSSNKQFWKAGDFDRCPVGASSSSSTAGMDHVRVHPKFLHSNATSHKWALGAFAELLDNSLDEVVNGATYVNVDMLKSNKEESKMLVIEDNGGGMNPDKMRQCMSLGYSEKSKMANTIGQYGNGFKTSTMRLGADVLVFSRCRGRDGKSPTRSIGLLSYTFLTRTGKEDIVVPMLDYEKEGRGWNKLMRSSPGDWTRNLETIVQWSPFSSEADLLQQFDSMGEQGTRVIIYNLWEDDEGELELDFDSDKHDIQIRGGNRDEKKIEMAQEFPNSRHFLTYRHSLRSYASILYLRVPPQFHMVLRGKDIVHHNIVNDMMLMQEVTYRPQPGADGIPKDSSMYAVVKIGFVKDAASHIDVQGFNVYHKNRLIKPFWRVWNATGSDGRGAIGVLEANFVEPAHDKQGFERTTVLARLEAKLLQMQKLYWSTNCHHIGYAPRRNKKLLNASAARDSSPEYVPRASIRHSSKSASPRWEPKHGNVVFGKGGNEKKTEPVAKQSKMGANRAYNENIHNSDEQLLRLENVELKDSLNTTKESFLREIEYERDRVKMLEALVKNHDPTNVTPVTLNKLQLENRELEDRLRNMEETFSSDLQLERERNKSVEAKIEESKQKIEEMSKEQEALIDIFSEERSRRDNEEENLRKKLKDAANTMQELLDKVLQLEQTKSPNK